MKSFKILSNSSVFISKQNPQTNFSNSRSLVIGQYNIDEFRCLINFCLNPEIFNFKISKIDLIIYLEETKINSNIEAFMLNIARNLDNYNPNTVTFETAPNFFQEAHFSRIETSYSKNCIIIDISKILKYWINNKISTFSITLLGLSQTSLIYISNLGNKRPFLEIYYDKKNSNHSNHDHCNHHNGHCNHQNSNNHNHCNHNHENSNNYPNGNLLNNDYYNNYQNNNYLNNHYQNNQSLNNAYQNRFTSERHIESPSDFFSNDLLPRDTINNSNLTLSRQEFNLGNYNNYIESNNHNNLASYTNTVSLACGNFISTSGILLSKNSVAYVKFDVESNTIKTKLTSSADGIYIVSKGLYKVDFFVNCRSEPFSTIELELNETALPLTQVQISSSDAPTCASTIINIPSDNMILKLKISTINTILVTTGICASLNLMKIN